MVVERVMGLGLLAWRDTHVKLKQITGSVLGFGLKWRTLTGRIYVFGKSRHTHVRVSDDAPSAVNLSFIDSGRGAMSRYNYT